jgi:hypothetical protein
MNDGATRRDLLRRGVTASLAGAGATALLAPAARAASVPSPPLTEGERLQRLLSVKLLSLFVYQQVLSSTVLGARARRALMPLRAHEQAHVRVLSARASSLGEVIPPGPASAADADRDLAHRQVPSRLGQLRGAHDALRLLLSVERVTIGVCFVALTTLETPDLIRLAAQIMATDAQHEAVVGEVRYPGSGAMAVPYGLVQGVQ